MPRHRLLAIAGALAALALFVWGVRHFLWSRWHVTTDDAYVEGHVANVTPRVAGTVVAVPVEDNTVVAAGTTLVQLDPTDFAVRLREATAALDRARQAVDEQVAAVEAARAAQVLAAAQKDQAEIDFRRVDDLRNRSVVSADEFDRARTALDVARARYDAATRDYERAQAMLGAEGTSRYDRPIVRQAESARDAAELDLGYATIAAPVAGVVTRRAIEVGQRVQPGQPLMALVPADLYVVANFKETELTPIRIGQAARLRVDLYPDVELRGHVDSIASGSGAAFSILPPENASGNWVKVVQRVPVKIVLDDPPRDRPLRVGLSVTASVDISDRSGPLLRAAPASEPPSAAAVR
jgi:membrane fusion protein (multidrug efflux system)